MREGNSEGIYHVLKREILTLALEPGQSLSEHGLCERFSVSRTPVRTAMQRLQSEGLIEVVPYRGSRVALLDYDEIQQTLYLRAAVESAVLRDFIPVCTPMVLEKIRYQVRKQAVLIKGDFQPTQFYEMDTRMHGIWFRETGKEKLWKMLQKAQVHYTRFRMLDIVATPDFVGLLREHEEFSHLIEEKQVEKVQELVYRHLYGGLERLEEHIDKELRPYFVSSKSGEWEMGEEKR